MLSMTLPVWYYSARVLRHRMPVILPTEVMLYIDGRTGMMCSHVSLQREGVEMQVWYALLRWEGDRWRPRFSYQPETLQVGIPNRI
jgi:hypothetical protein